MNHFLMIGSIALNKKISRIVTEEDGCQVTTDLALTVFKDGMLMLLEPQESWSPALLHAAAAPTKEQQVRGTFYTNHYICSIRNANQVACTPLTADINLCIYCIHTIFDPHLREQPPMQSKLY